MTARGPFANRVGHILLGGALLVGLLVRAPGIWWGANFPPGWYGHHPDEYTHVLHAQLLINRDQPPYSGPQGDTIGLANPWAAGYSVTQYPKGLAVHLAAPAIALGVLRGTRGEPPPSPAVLVPLGRLIVVLYGSATILVVFFLARRLFQRPAIAHVASWIMALGGLHVTQSHFFLSDVPALFWFLWGILFLWDDLADEDAGTSAALAAAAFCFGVAFGLKVWVAAFPSLGLAALWRQQRIWRVSLTAAFAYLGFAVVNLGLYTPMDLRDTLATGVADPWEFSKLTSALLYLVELPTLVSLPVLLMALVGAWVCLRALVDSSRSVPLSRVNLVILVPMGVHAGLVLFQLDHFPRHLIPFVPWMAILGALGVVELAARLPQQRARLAIHAAVVLYLAAFVFDAEKGFIDDPRNRAAEWLSSNVKPGSSLWWYYHRVPGYSGGRVPEGRPDVIVEEMHHANHFLSGMGLRNSLPRDYRGVFDSGSQENVDFFQSLFTGTAEYVEVARFDEGYFMPEFRVVDNWIGNRSRNYLAEIVVFRRTDAVLDGNPSS